MKNTWFQKLKSSLSKSSSSISQGITKIITSKRLDEATLQDLEDLLISADIGVDSSVSIIENLKKEKFNKDIDISEIKTFLADQIEIKLASSYKKLIFNKDQSPHIIIVVGVNGSGKTTTIAKLANNFKKDGAKVLIGAADTFRAAAIEQITSWASRLNIEIVASDIVKDAASIAYDTVKKAKDDKFDVAIIDTAGRLAIDEVLMDEIKAIHSAVSPSETLFVVDSMTGQDAANTAKAFGKTLPLTGVILTKVDADTRGGAALSVRTITDRPIKFLGVGEKTGALDPFHPDRLASRILGMGDMLWDALCPCQCKGPKSD